MSRDKEDEELYERILIDSGDELSDVVDKPKRQSIQSFLREYKLKRQIQDLKDEKLELIEKAASV